MIISLIYLEIQLNNSQQLLAHFIYQGINRLFEIELQYSSKRFLHFYLHQNPNSPRNAKLVVILVILHFQTPFSPICKSNSLGKPSQKNLLPVKKTFYFKIFGFGAFITICLVQVFEIWYLKKTYRITQTRFFQN